MAKKRQPVDLKRRIPRQARAAETVTAILEAAAQILEAAGLSAFTTNAVAERAGVSIGTLYQYFPDKAALLRLLAERELKITLANVEKAMRDAPEWAPEERVRAVVRAMINAFGGRQRARKAVVQAMLSQGAVGGLSQPVAAFLASHDLPQLSREQAFVVSRSLMGAIRSAVFEEQPFLKSRAFEDECVRLVTVYLVAVTPPQQSSIAPG
jgi:AcrR family transcriptional regulator